MVTGKRTQVSLSAFAVAEGARSSCWLLYFIVLYLSANVGQQQGSLMNGLN